MLNVYPDNYSTNLILPAGPSRTRAVFEWYFRNPEEGDVHESARRTFAFSDEIQLEDTAMCESVQRGLASRLYSNGRYSVLRESGVYHFHRLLTEFLG